MLNSCKPDIVIEEWIDLPDLSARVKAGGETTIYTSSSNAYSYPAPNLAVADLEKHLEGDKNFEQAFVAAPAITFGGVGTIYNNTSCISCHAKDGRANFPNDLNALSGFFLRASLPGTNANGGPVPVPGFGAQLQNQAIFGYVPEAEFGVNYTSIQETFADGTVVTLEKPEYYIQSSYIPFPAEALLSPRIGPPMYGLGLLQGVEESTILAMQDIDDADGDGISGKANYVYDGIHNMTALGRFGWKANTASILEQSAGAYNHDMGITSPYAPIETGFAQSNGSDGLSDDPEITASVVEDVAFYCQTLAVPASRNATKIEVRQGARLFQQIGCDKCHVPELRTGMSDIAALSQQIIYPYSDLLLHDMGAELADGRPDYLATGTEWKTRPLWGIGLNMIVNGHTRFLHDGRARNLEEAILWHGGEGKNSKDKYKKLTLLERQQLLTFLNAL